MQLILPDWNAPRGVKAFTTTRFDGVSGGAYKGLNLGDHVKDDPEHVKQNRQILIDELGLQRNPQWLSQVHGIDIIEAKVDGVCREADGCWSQDKGQACIVMTADCLPVLFADGDGKRVAAVHAGWRGLLDGILEQAVGGFQKPENLHVWLGPAIGPDAFEVGQEVRDQFVAVQAQANQAFTPVEGSSGKFLADIYQLARQRLNSVGVNFVSGGEYCTYTDAERFYSYRRDGVTGRMASLIWIE
ncbi:peptidoglycan editing factor PgeF [Neptuniibacter sp. QD48_11]|uniref:peptidoglycan editing factor PgeF n=1 Tax=unclassified Neptuniibacter TaxID=2630693 RepID=UPI0039F629EB